MKKINTINAPEAIGPYSQAMVVGDKLYSSGQIGLVPGKMVLVEGGIEHQTRQVCDNLGAVLAEAGLEFLDVFKTTIFLDNIEDFKIVNEIYAKYFSHCPARSTIEVSRLPLGALVEIELIANKQ